jgi:hypothetical protein
MSFSTSFCITNTGSLLQGTSVDFYSDVDGYTTPFQTDILLSNITGDNCPYVLTNIPNGTTTLQILDVNSSCCVTVPITQNTYCDICDLGFDVYSSTTLGRIVAGNLTGSCDNNITDYLIEWYNITDLNTIVYTSGKGSEFLPYGFPHPLVGITSIPALSGTYIPIIKKVRLNGINYSSDLEPGFVQATLNCFDNTTVSVSPLTCSNGTNTGNYSHLIQFSGSSQGQPPSSLSSTFILSANTNYFAWRFNAFDVQDTVRITYYGSNYNNTPILLESYNVGNDNSVVNYSTTPKIVKTFNNSLPLPGFPKVTCLTGLTRSENDFIILEIIPNQSNPKTDFQLYFTCLENYDCNTCYDNYLNTPYKILENSITATTLTCGRVNISYNVSGCSNNDLFSSDYYKYSYTNALNSNNNSIVTHPNGTFSLASVISTGITSCSYSQVGSGIPNPCFPQSNETITFSKTNTGVGGTGFVYMTFTSFSDLSDYYNTFQQRIQESGIESDPTKIEYYRSVILKISVPQNSDDPCGDSSPKQEYRFHTSTVVTTGQTGNTYYMSLTMPTITRQINFDTCALGCLNFVNNLVSLINISSTATTNTQQWISDVGNRLTYPFPEYEKITSATTSVNSGNTLSRFVRNESFLNRTLPMSGTNNTLIPSISSTTCNLVGEITNLNNLYSEFYQRFLFEYRLESSSQDPLNNYKILAKNIVNGRRDGNLFRIYEVQNGSVIYSDPNFII